MAEKMAGLQGDKVRLVPPDKHTHLENSIRWLNDPEVTQYLLMTIGVTRGMEEEWFDRVQKRDVEVVWAILDDQDRHIGFTGIHRINWKLRMGGTGTVIGEKSAWRKGFGSDAMLVRTKFAFETLGLRGQPASPGEIRLPPGGHCTQENVLGRAVVRYGVVWDAR